jgi:hypothetical protein
MILFNANLIHVGTINEKDDHLRIQMKVTHKEDIDTIGYYENFHKILTKSKMVTKNAKTFILYVSIIFGLCTRGEYPFSARNSKNK